LEFTFNPLNAELNPICHMLALLGTRHIFHVSGLRVKTRRRTQLMGTDCYEDSKVQNIIRGEINNPEFMVKNT